MATTLFSIVGSIYMLASSPMAHAECSPGLTAEIVSAERIVDSLRPDKAGQMRVFAIDGSEYSAGQANWMKGQMRFVLRACARGDEAPAAATLRSVQDVLNAHRKSS
jgi:hypothetical protein